MSRLYTRVLGYVPDKQDVWEIDSVEVRKQIAHFDSTAGVLPDSLRAIAYQSLSGLWHAWGNPVRAGEMSEWLWTHSWK